MINEIIKTSYTNLKNIKKGNFESIKSELELLDIKYTEDELIKALAIVSASNSIDEALKFIDAIDSDEIIKTKTHIQKQQIAEKIKIEKREIEKRRQELIAESEKERKNIIKEQADANNFLKQISNYKLINADDYEELELKVNKAIKSGWIPYGSVAHTINRSTKRWYVVTQTMIKFKD